MNTDKMNPDILTEDQNNKHHLQAAVADLKETKNALILAHYYQEDAIQEVADFVGDSLALSRKAQANDAGIIVFAGVHFMAETAKILSPGKKVLLPDTEAGCSLADACPPQAFRKFIDQHPDHWVISYINCSAEVKAMSDIICTSSNAGAIINSIPEDEPIIFAPDKNLGKHLIHETGREMLLWDGVCEVHEVFSMEKVFTLKSQYPEAEVLAHPECSTPIRMVADFVGSTGKMLNYAKASQSHTFIVLTEPGIIFQMERDMPGKKFIPGPPHVDNTCACSECHFMKMNTLEKLYYCLANESPEIHLSEDIQQRALQPLQKMLDISAASVV